MSDLISLDECTCSCHNHPVGTVSHFMPCCTGVRKPATDPHPKGAYGEHGKLAIVGCNCRHCVQEMIDRDTGHGSYRDTFKL